MTEKEEYNIPWWYTNIFEEDLIAAHKSLEYRKLSLGSSVSKFEEVICELENAQHGIATTSGTSALHLVGTALEISKGDEVIVPNRTWIATAHAFRSLGAEIKVASVSEKNMLIDLEDIKRLINPKTKAIIAVSLNGRNVISKELIEIAKNNDIWLVEDAAQGVLAPRPYDLIKSNFDKYCRTYSFSMAKMITTGQGGMILTNCENFSNELRSRRTHGIENVTNVNKWERLGLNYRMSDVLASIGINQVKRLSRKVEKYLEIYEFYKNKIDNDQLKLIPVNTASGEIPIYVEALWKNREYHAELLKEKNIETRTFYPDISEASYLSNDGDNLTKTIFSKEGIYLPSGDGLSLAQLNRIVFSISNI